MPLETDILDRLRTDFCPSERPMAIDELSASGETGRIARCVVQAASGSLERLRALVNMADRDFRDVIVAGEYDDAMRKVRDLRVSFLIQSPGDFWIEQIAVAADKRGYRLTELNSRPATVGPFDYACDHSEGIATFSNDNTTVTVQKRNRCWSIFLNGTNLRPFGLDAVFDDEERFRIQLDYYLSRT